MHTEKINPLRALWVPFKRGQPFRVPNNSAFQKLALKAALALLEWESGPVLVDYLEEVPDGSDAMLENDMTGMVCPIDLPRILGVDAPASELGHALLAEMDSLAPWYDLPVWTLGRTTMGPSDLDINDAAKFVAAFLEDQ